MSTRSRIAIATNNSYRSIYCHFDGYIEYVGSILQEFYNTGETAEKLITHGDLSFLAKFTEPLKEFDESRRDSEELVKHSFKTPQKNVTVAYHRDRGDHLNIVESKTFEDLLKIAQDTDAEYLYLFKDNRWYVFTECFWVTDK